MVSGVQKLSLVAVAIVVTFAGSVARALPQGGSQYQVVKVCSLLSLAEVKKLAPWPPHMDAIAKGEEEPVGATGSACEYPTVRIQVLAYSTTFAESLRTSRLPVEKVTGVGDEASIRNNRNRYAELYAKVGQHTLTIQLNIDTHKTFEAAKAAAIEIGKAYAAKLR